ncbi:hypothetical protein GWI33_022347 [Rhynchophorus ferrugineus]|uniref:Uncharacterized protein n=1 Tax=Rhynchophorus ferrugineus TaxID=354439 RepID=A0A834LZC4_RHYFE|nr:hypothetical protein GWI33_022349 [Rhynchophorus ferrugineus]KAF7264795.1 hypothetical protein GWI33_022347 [Rhynchophorus ferrugineus]
MRTVFSAFLSRRDRGEEKDPPHHQSDCLPFASEEDAKGHDPILFNPNRTVGKSTRTSSFTHWAGSHPDSYVKGICFRNGLNNEISTTPLNPRPRSRRHSQLGKAFFQKIDARCRRLHRIRCVASDERKPETWKKKNKYLPFVFETGPISVHAFSQLSPSILSRIGGLVGGSRTYAVRTAFEDHVARYLGRRLSNRTMSSMYCGSTETVSREYINKSNCGEL